MKILFIHPNMPGQYRNLCRFAAQNPGNTVVFLTKPTQVNIPGIHKVEYLVERTAGITAHRYLINSENAVLQGQETWRACRKLEQEEGFRPDIVVAHPGWGDCLFLKDLWPEVPLLSYFEFYYHANGADVGFVPEEQPGFDDKAKIRIKNITNLLNLEAADWGISPTTWQRELHPKEFLHKISLLHDGIDTKTCRPDPQAKITLPGGQTFRAGDEVVTYIARNFEPYRGFPTFMQAAERLLKERPNLHIIAIGADGVSYGRSLPKGQTYRREWLKRVKLDTSRLHFVGTLDYASLIRAMQVSAAHIYLTYPFVLSWSSMEAMATGCAMIASDTQPVREIMQDGENALLVDFFSPEQVAEKVVYALDNREKMQSLRKAARQVILDSYDLHKLLPSHMKLIEDVARNGNGLAFEEKRLVRMAA